MTFSESRGVLGRQQMDLAHEQAQYDGAVARVQARFAECLSDPDFLQFVLNLWEARPCQSRKWGGVCGLARNHEGKCSWDVEEAKR